MPKFTVKFINSTDEEFKGCALIATKRAGGDFTDGVRPVAAGGTVIFKTDLECDKFNKWRFIAAIDYSDDPNDLSVVVVDTGTINITKCDYEITARPNFTLK